jgi:eukaryotic-like serine/threonine-protein kinase
VPHGAPEYPGSSAESAVARLSRPPRVPPTVPQSWADLLTEMTADDPAARPPAHEVARILPDLPTTASPPARTLVADESSTRVRTKPITVAPRMPPPRPVPVGSRERHGAAYLAAAAVLATALIVAVLVLLLPQGGTNVAPGQPPPSASAGPDRLPQDLRDLQSVVQP